MNDSAQKTLNKIKQEQIKEEEDMIAKKRDAKLAYHEKMVKAASKGAKVSIPEKKAPTVILTPKTKKPAAKK